MFISDCEKPMENQSTNVYNPACGSEISEYLGNQRLNTNAQNYSTDNKNYSTIPNGE